MGMGLALGETLQTSSLVQSHQVQKIPDVFLACSVLNVGQILQFLLMVRQLLRSKGLLGLVCLLSQVQLCSSKRVIFGLGPERVLGALGG